MKRNHLLPAITLLISLTGLLISAYLAGNHYSAFPSGAFCDFGDTVSCSVINNSVYSEVFGVPVALLGALWFFVAFLLSLAALKDKTKPALLLLPWSVLGVLFVFYLVYVEIILQAICPFCTIIHLIVISLLIISFLLYRNHHFSRVQKQ